MFNIENLTFYLNSLENEKSKLESFIATAPAAHLKCRKSRNRNPAIYIVNDSAAPDTPKEQYVNKKTKAAAVRIVRKMHAELKVKELDQKIAAIRQLLEMLTAPSPSNQFLMDNPELAALFPHSLSNNEKLLQWKNAAYERSFDYPDQIKHNTIVPGLKVRSKSEGDIIARLELFGVPYHYDEVNYINGSKQTIDFVCLNVSTGKKWFWDHRGMMDDPAYIKKTLYNEQVFFNAGYMPGINMIVTYETRNHPLNIQEVDVFIKQYLL